MPELPGGTVTFLFTDIEGSTALWERDQAAMAAAVDRHLDLNHNAAMFPRGIVDKTVGKGVQAAFAAAPDAVAGRSPPCGGCLLTNRARSGARE